MSNIGYMYFIFKKKFKVPYEIYNNVTHKRPIKFLTSRALRKLFMIEQNNEEDIGAVIPGLF